MRDHALRRAVDPLRELVDPQTARRVEREDLVVDRPRRPDAVGDLLCRPLAPRQGNRPVDDALGKGRGTVFAETWLVREEEVVKAESVPDARPRASVWLQTGSKRGSASSAFGIPSPSQSSGFTPRGSRTRATRRSTRTWATGESAGRMSCGNYSKCRRATDS